MRENGTKTDEDTQKRALINPSVNSALHIQSILLRKEIKLTAEWKMGLNTRF